ncbi:MAG: hypothetical protein A2857_06795 [Candidatus Levybacteria bacterium RIFCSPHIGHO2_01_FULL_36_15]|nr:MAG: hypothetical protein A2857_06795 [Candidatus Levybacteria bacterium RIFCSPHIGHO2_01_FULL_36_15]
MNTNNDILSQTKNSILKLSNKFNIRKDKIEAFLQPNRVVEINVPIRTKNGKLTTFKGYRSQHNNNLGPYKGGIRFHQNVSREEVEMLSLLMSLKCAVINLPYGGAKGGMIVDPKTLSQKELENLSRGYVKKIYDVIGPEKDIPAPDVNTNPTIINWMVDEYVKLSSKKNISENVLYAAFTGKPKEKYGLEGRTEATGWGGIIVLCELVKKLGLKNKDLTIAVQGFGNVGYHFSLFASQKGFKVVAVSDSKGGITNKNLSTLLSLDIPLVRTCKKKKGFIAGCYCVGGVCDLTRGRPISNEDLIALPVDILVPAALENVINKSNMHRVKTKIIIEMANGPVSYEAYEYLTKKKVIIVPDILSNGGGVAGSYLEWKQNLENSKYEKEFVLKELERMMQKSFEYVWKISKNQKLNLKEACLFTALKRIMKFTPN